MGAVSGIRFLPVGASRLAYETRGDGPPLVAPAWWTSHLELDWESQAFHRFCEPLTDGYARSGTTGSASACRDRALRDSDLTLEAEVATLRALVDELGHERVSLVGGSSAARPAAARRSPSRPRSRSGSSASCCTGPIRTARRSRPPTSRRRGRASRDRRRAPTGRAAALHRARPCELPLPRDVPGPSVRAVAPVRRRLPVQPSDRGADARGFEV